MTETDGYQLVTLYRVSDPANEDSLKIVSVEHGCRHPFINEHWDKIEHSFKDIALPVYNYNRGTRV